MSLHSLEKKTVERKQEKKTKKNKENKKIYQKNKISSNLFFITVDWLKKLTNNVIFLPLSPPPKIKGKKAKKKVKEKKESNGYQSKIILN